MALGMLVDGQWVNEERDRTQKGAFQRPPTRFRRRVTADGSSGFPAQAGRYHLYVSLACPWAHRTLILRALKGLEQIITLSIVDPLMQDNGWFFSDGPGCIPDIVNHSHYLREVYTKADPHFTGRVTVPILWDRETGQIVNNESREILRMFDIEFAALARNPVDFYPEPLRARIDETMDAIYEPINNGVYRSGFATTQTAYEQAVTELFTHLDHWEHVLSHQRYLTGGRITEADWCMFTTLVRFDAVYYSHFKCNLKRIVDYPNLWNYLKDLYQQPGIQETCDFAHIKQHYYRSHTSINPTGIVPQGPLLDFDKPHNRG
ncbi:glutathione S-transferase family protein [Anthocerotibacter panamensis]|uniref:glutathione S-transferase family protein n=1 Tax=Anthocerotibacter panamensis TaxID=2857077 RepID=UPI001FD8EDDD|nr:glutathione S-transferase family protein [Anthocerotibacter panamensis]